MNPSPETPVTNTLFEEAYWLDAVAPGAWDKVEVIRAGRLLGRLPFVVKRRYGLSAVSTPDHTPWLGPWIAASGARGTNELGHQHDILATLVRGLPDAGRTLVACAPEFTNLMALHWAGYALHLAYTYRLSALDAPEILWRGLRDKARNTCRKAEKTLAVTTERSLADILPVLDKTFRRQGIDFTARNAALERIEATMAARGQRIIYAAQDAQGQIHAFAYIVFDNRHSFYLAGGADPELRGSGAQALTMWHAIKNAGKHSKVFDFEGSMIAPIELFVRGFGPVQIPRYSARKSSVAFQMVDMASRMAGDLRALKGGLVRRSTGAAHR